MNAEAIVPLPDFDESVRKLRWRSSLLVGLFVVVISFAYGISVGLSRNPAHASAARFAVVPAVMNHLILPAGVQIVPAGKEMLINGAASEMASFTSTRGIKDLLTEQVRLWEARGFQTYGATTNKRGVAFARDPKTGDRHSIVAFFIPPILRARVSNGAPVQGTVSAVSGRGGNRAESMRAVPGVPLPPGGSAGAVFSSKDPGGRSYSSIYSLPGGITESVDFYREFFLNEGWRETNQSAGEKFSLPIASLTFRRGKQEAMLLFSGVSSASASRVAAGRAGSVGSVGTMMFVTVGGAIAEFEHPTGKLS